MKNSAKFIKGCLMQPRLLLWTFLLSMLLVGCFVGMTGLGVAVASTQSLARQDHASGYKSASSKPKKGKQESPGMQGDPGNLGNPELQGNQTNPGLQVKPGDPKLQGGHGSTKDPAVALNNSSVVAPGDPGARPGLPPTGSDPGDNPLP